MLRTRRRDNNVKPNRRLDRKSSRGMLYENEELRLKTININAEIERGQSDIKKLKRENEMLKKEIWCLRDEYDKLDKMLKDKKIDFSASSTTHSSSSSESDSCSSCTEESEEVETSQNLKNVQKTNLKNIHDQFDNLSIVTEEMSCENSDTKSLNNRNSLSNDETNNMLWNYNDKDVIKPDQSYPIYGSIAQNRSQTLPNQMQMNYFSPIQHSKSFDNNNFNQGNEAPLYPGDLYAPQLPCHNNNQSQTPPIAISPSLSPAYENQETIFPSHSCEDMLSKKLVQTNASNFYQNMILVPKNNKPPPELRSMEKRATDLIVKIDNQNFQKGLTYSNTTPSTTFSNGGNLEELLNDIESISQRGFPPNQSTLPTIQEPSHDPDFFHPDIQERDLTYSQNPVMNHLLSDGNMEQRHLSGSDERILKSELNVVLMPKAMPLIGFDKYKNIQRSFESLNSKHLESMSASQQNLCILSPNTAETELPPMEAPNIQNPIPPNFQMDTPYPGKRDNQENNPFFFGNLNDNYVNSDYFNRRYNPKHFVGNDTQESQSALVQSADKKDISGTIDKTPLTAVNQQVENEENIKLKTSKPDTKEKDKKQDTKTKQDQAKSPKLSITRKVSIHFKGKKEREKLKKLALESSSPESKSTSSKSVAEGKKSLFDFRVNTDTSKDKPDTKIPSSPKPKHQEKACKHVHQKTPSTESKKSTTETSNADAKNTSSTDNEKRNSDKKEKDGRKDERKSRKSVSISPDRTRHVHVVHEGIRKHKKHRRDRSGTSRTRNPSVDHRLRERSYSICTDRSMIGPSLGFGMGYGSYLYDEYSDRERTNSGSSCESHDNQRKMSTISNVPINGKVPWCGCWGNGCL